MRRLAWRSLLGLGCLMCLVGCASRHGPRDIAPVDSLDIDWLHSQVDWRSVIRVTVEGAQYQLTRPRVTAQGLEYGDARAVGALEAEVERLPQTVQLPEIDGIKVRESGKSFGYALVGAALGLAAGAMFALPYTSDPDVVADPYGVMAVFSAAGALVGLVVGERRYEWKAIYERRGSSGV